MIKKHQIAIIEKKLIHAREKGLKPCFLMIIGKLNLHCENINELLNQTFNKGYFPVYLFTCLKKRTQSNQLYKEELEKLNSYLECYKKSDDLHILKYVINEDFLHEVFEIYI